MIDYFALALTHGLILVALFRIVGQDELDADPEIEARRRKRKRPHQGTGQSTGQRDA